MNKMIALMAFFIASTAGASGKIQYLHKFNVRNSQQSPAVGISIWEPLVGPLHYSQWTGGGWDAKEGKNFIASKHGLGVQISRLSFGAEYGLEHSAGTVDHSVTAKVGFKLW